MNENKKPESMDTIFSMESLEFMAQYKVRSHIMRVLRESFDVQEMLVIKEKKYEG